MRTEEVLDLDGEGILPAHDDDILPSVYDVNEAVFVLSRHISRISLLFQQWNEVRGHEPGPIVLRQTCPDDRSSFD